jgi:elongation factor Ts
MFAIRRLNFSACVSSPVSRLLSSTPVTANMVKQLRDTSGAPMMDCKKALGACDGDVEKAMDWLRAKGIARAAAGKDRIAQEGLIAVLTSAQGVTFVEVNSETDFVAKNSDFHQFVNAVAKAAANTTGVQSDQKPFGSAGSMTTISPDALLAQNKGALQSELGLAVSTIRENLVIKRVTTLRPGPGCLLAAYVHSKVADFVFDGVAGGKTSIVMGKSASVVCLHAPSATQAHLPQLEEHARRVAMHVIAAGPAYCNENEVGEDFLARERAIMDEQMATDPKNVGKKKDVLEKVREGKLRKRLSEVCLTSQPYVVEEGAPAVGKFLLGVGKLIGAGEVSAVAFLRWGLGETNVNPQSEE